MIYDIKSSIRPPGIRPGRIELTTDRIQAIYNRSIPSMQTRAQQYRFQIYIGEISNSIFCVLRGVNMDILRYCIIDLYFVKLLQAES